MTTLYANPKSIDWWGKSESIMDGLKSTHGHYTVISIGGVCHKVLESPSDIEDVMLKL